MAPWASLLIAIRIQSYEIISKQSLSLLRAAFVTRLKDVNALRRGSPGLTPAAVSAVIEADTVFLHLYPCGDMQFWCGTKLDHGVLSRIRHRRQASISQTTNQDVVRTKTSKARPSTNKDGLMARRGEHLHRDWTTQLPRERCQTPIDRHTPT